MSNNSELMFARAILSLSFQHKEAITAHLAEKLEAAKEQILHASDMCDVAKLQGEALAHKELIELINSSKSILENE